MKINHVLFTGKACSKCFQLFVNCSGLGFFLIITAIFLIMIKKIWKDKKVDQTPCLVQEDSSEVFIGNPHTTNVLCLKIRPALYLKKKKLAFLYLKFNKILVEDIDKTSSKIQSVIFTYFPSKRNQVQNICRSIWGKDPLWKFQINNVYIVNLPLNGTPCPTLHGKGKKTWICTCTLYDSKQNKCACTLP